MIGSMGFAGLCILKFLSGNEILGLLRERLSPMTSLITDELISTLEYDTDKLSLSANHR